MARSFQALIIVQAGMLASAFVSTSLPPPSPRARTLRLQQQCHGIPTLKLSAALQSAYCNTMNGCWAGWQASFDAAGSLIPVDRKYLTDSQVAWDQVPAGLELLSSEDNGRRKFVLVYPEDGCACDNLFGELSESVLDLAALDGDAARGVFTIDDTPGKGGALWYLRTTFLTESDRRTRVSLRFDAAKGALGSIRVAVERRWESQHTALQIPMSLKKSGGRSGLDATFVTQAIQSKTCFADMPVDKEKAPDATAMLLPGNVAVQVCESQLKLGVGGRWVTRTFKGFGNDVQVGVE